MEVETKIITSVQINIRFDENLVMNLDLLYDLFFDTYHNYFGDIFIYRNINGLSIADIEIRYSGKEDINYVNDTNYKSYLPLFLYLETKGLIKLREVDGCLHNYIVLDIDLLEKEIKVISKKVNETFDNYKKITRDALLENIIED